MTVKEATTFYVNKSYEQPIKKVEESVKAACKKGCINKCKACQKIK